MARKSHEIRKGDVVYAAEDLRNVPVGTRGRVAFVSGLTWTRYRVDFDNGVSVGSLDRHLLRTNGDSPASA
jgi:hypothetical protein